MYRIRRPTLAVGIPLASASALLVAWSVSAAPPTALSAQTLSEPIADTTPQTVGLDLFADPLAFPETIQRAYARDQRTAPDGGAIAPSPAGETKLASWSIANETWGNGGGVHGPSAASFSVPAPLSPTAPRPDPSGVATPPLGAQGVDPGTNRGGASSPETSLVFWPPFGDTPSAPALASYTVAHVAHGGEGTGEPDSELVAWPTLGDPPAAPALDGFGGAHVGMLADGQ